MKAEKEQVQSLFDELVKHLIVLSLPAEYQREYIGLGHTGDELAIDFDNYYTSRKEQYLKEGFINHEQSDLLDKLDSFFEERSGGHHEEFWEDVDSHSDWQKVRMKAKECLAALGKQDYGLKVKYESEKTYYSDQVQWNMHSTKTQLVKRSIH